jgi:hypothetical protein
LTVSPGAERPSGAQDNIFITARQCWFVDVRRPLWRENGSVVYNWFWASPALSFWGPSLVGFLSLECQVNVFLSPLGHSYLVISASIMVPMFRLLRLAGRRWRYSSTSQFIADSHWPCTDHSIVLSLPLKNVSTPQLLSSGCCRLLFTQLVYMSQYLAKQLPFTSVYFLHRLGPNHHPSTSFPEVVCSSYTVRGEDSLTRTGRMWVACLQLDYAIQISRSRAHVCMSRLMTV